MANALKQMVLAVGLVGVLTLLAGCATHRDYYEPGGNFHGNKAADAVLRFSSWDYIFLVKPVYQENGFLQQVQRDTMRQVMDQLAVPREMAVVVIGRTYEGKKLDAVVGEMKNVLGSCGFQRVVFLRSNCRKNINGSQVIDDSRLPIIAAQARTLPQL
jgi:hypothetical protein